MSIGQVDVFVKQALVLCMEDVEGQGFDMDAVKDSVVYVVRALAVDARRRELVLYERERGVKRNVSSLARELSMLVMNDLLSRLSREELPLYYANLSKTLDQAQVKHVRQDDDVVVEKQCNKNREEEEDEEEEQQRKKKEEEEEEQQRMEEARIREQEVKEQEDKERRKAWILQNAYSGSEDGEISDDDDDDDGSIEDWEIWGSPKDIERKKAEKARNMLSREDKIAIIAHDMRCAKGDAAVAKANRDKEGQKHAGAVIGRLKREMQELGINEQDLDLCAVQDNTEQPKGDETKRMPDTIINQKEEERENLSSDDEPEPAFDMFGDDAPEVEEPKLHRHMAYASIFLNSTLREAVRTRGKKGSKRVDSKAPPKKHPKAILQQLVQKEGWGAPRFEKLSQEKHGTEFKYRFQILVDVKQSKGKQSIRPGIHRFALPAELDGWDTIQQAQDACATKALMDLYGKTGNVAWDSLKEPFDALLFDIAEHGGDDMNASAESKSQERDEFLDSLLSSVHLGEDNAQDETLEKIRSFVNNDKMMKSIEVKKTELASKQVEQNSRSLHQDLAQWKVSDDGLYWMEKRSALPVSQIQGSLLKALEVHDVVLVSGETGSGKTTQVPQIVLDGSIESLCGAQCSIVCTQPRRIAAISVADRVSEERGEKGPGKKGSLVGYSVRFDSATNATTRLEFCTTGILLRRISADPALAKFSHIIVDEVHERTMQSDFLIAMLRDLVEKRRQAGLPLKVILMSATMNTQMVSDYFFGCPILHASGRTYPVQHLFLEDVYETSDYVLDMDSPAAVKVHQGLRGGQKKLENSSGSKHKALIKSNWGDDINDVVLNQYFDESKYETYRYVDGDVHLNSTSSDLCTCFLAALKPLEIFHA